MTYISNITSTGALTKTPKRIVGRICELVGSQPKPMSMLELGAGKGEITHALLEKFPCRFERYLAIELNTAFSNDLAEKNPSITVVNDDARNFRSHLIQPVDLIISSIPISFFEKSDQIKFIDELSRSIKPNGKLIILFHAFWLVNRFKKMLSGSKIECFLHIPPYYLLTFEIKGS